MTESDQGASPNRFGPSLWQLVWPGLLLPVSGWLIYWSWKCPNNPGSGFPLLLAAPTLLAIPGLLAAAILTARWYPANRSLHRVARVAEVGLTLGFLAACAWGVLVWFVAGMVEC